MTKRTVPPCLNSRRHDFERALSCEPFKGLKAIFDSLSPDRDLYETVNGTNSYEELLLRLGYKIALTQHIHVQNSLSRLGSTGGIKAILPYHDTPTQRSLPTVVSFNFTVTTTPESAGFFNQMLAALKTHLAFQTKNAV